MSTHTPGPWTVSPLDDGFFTIDADEYQIGEAYGYDDARLMAAAPDLLAERDALRAENARLVKRVAELENLVVALAEKEDSAP